jgi:hypothetical protein
MGRLQALLPSGCRPAEVARVLIARDPRLTEVIVGYAIDCVERRIIAWGAGASHERRVPPLCKRPAYVRDAVLACVRHWR